MRLVSSSPVSATEFGHVEFTFTKDNVDYVRSLLECNQGSISKVFSIVWGDKEFSLSPVLVVDFIERVRDGKIQFPT